MGVFPGSELIRRKKGKGYEMGRIAGWAADRQYTHLVVVNEDMKKPSELRLVRLFELLISIDALQMQSR